MARQDDRILAPGLKQLLLLFGQPRDRYYLHQVERLQHLHRPSQLPLAAIHDQQIGQYREGGIGFCANQLIFLGSLPASESAGEHFLHAGKIVWTTDGFNVEMAVKIPAGCTLFKNDHTAH